MRATTVADSNFSCVSTSRRSFVNVLVLLAVGSCFSFISGAPEAHAFFVDGSGHYGLRGETRTSPGFQKDKGTYQAIEQSFRLLGEARFNDRSSAFLELRLFPNEREAYLGDQAQPASCEPRDDPNNPDTECNDRVQTTGEPRYKNYEPTIRKAFVRYAFDYCIVEAGRRPRNWGLGMFLDSGSDPFETDASVFDGIDCKINVQKSQILGFSIGFDKLQETGYYVNDPYLRDPDTTERSRFDAQDRKFGSNDAGDDIDQFFFTIEYDDRKANAGSSFTKNIGVYFSQATAKSLNDGGANTDLKFLDLYTGLYFGNMAIRNELLFRMGKSADPNWKTMGGDVLADGAPATNNVQTIALAGEIEWTMGHSGAYVGPSEYNRGNASKHALRFDYAFAPGDETGYYRRAEADGAATDFDGFQQDGSDRKAEAYSYHRNFKPALIFFNARPEQDDMIVNGVFNPSRLTNATLYGLEYAYESLEGGNFAVKFITGHLNTGIPQAVKAYYEAPESNVGATRPAGYHGLFLGYELDLVYTYKIGREAEIGIAGAAALPGDAWQVHSTEKPSNNFLLQSHVAFYF